MSRTAPRPVVRRRVLGALAGSPFLFAATVSLDRARAQSKRSKEEAVYQPSPKDGNECSGCAHFIEGGECRVVEGEIAPDGWCRLWVAA